MENNQDLIINLKLPFTKLEQFYRKKNKIDKHDFIEKQIHETSQNLIVIAIQF